MAHENSSLGAPAIGAVTLHDGATGNLIFSITSPFPFDKFGTSLAALNDVNNDGVVDFAVGAPGDGTNGANAGRIDLRSGLDGSLIATYLGDAASDLFGQSLAAINDLNGDGKKDIIVGAPGGMSGVFEGGSGSAGTGYVRVLSGHDGSIIMTIPGPTAGSAMGFAVAAIDDVDGDGLQEIGCGAPRADDPQNNIETGAVLVVAGDNSGTICLRFGLAAGDHLGTALASAKDANGDGFGDYIVGSANDSRGGPDAGSVQIVSTLNNNVIADLIGTQSFALFGSAVAHVGDVNGDGLGDVACGAILHDGPITDGGLVSLHTAATGILIEDVYDFESSSRWGQAICGMGDVNGDGFDEFAASKPNAMGSSFFAGSVKTISHAGTRSYHGQSTANETLTLSFVPGPVTERGNGSVILDGASPFDTGLIAVSFAAADFDFSGLSILVNPDPTNLVVSQPFLFQFDGSAFFLADIRHPFLGGLRIYVQGFDSQFPYGTSNGLEIRLL